MNYQEACEQVLRMEEESNVLKQKTEQAEKIWKQQTERMRAYTDRLYREKYDVDQMEKNSLSSIIAKLTGSYQKKYEEEYQGYLEAKRQYDEFQVSVAEAERDYQYYRNQCQRMQQKIKEEKKRILKEYPEGQEVARKNEEILRKCYSQMKELEEAIRAVGYTIQLASQILKEFDSAYGWSVYDTFLGGGAISSMGKHSHIDKASTLLNQLYAADLKMRKEVSDVHTVFMGEISFVSEGTKTMDILFDNIISDWKVHGIIVENMNKVEEYIKNAEQLRGRLQQQKSTTEKQIKILEL